MRLGGYILDQMLDYVLNHMLDYIIISLMTIALQLLSFWREFQQTNNCQKAICN